MTSFPGESPDDAGDDEDGVDGDDDDKDEDDDEENDKAEKRTMTPTMTLIRSDGGLTDYNKSRKKSV